ncbi:hypothetical protein AFLA_001601 [Aspergillus flavus NRRL3357]|nr:hypothetical protein AFLA_001601 [Aspergillus flavus NRRL3357]
MKQTSTVLPRAPTATELNPEGRVEWVSWAKSKGFWFPGPTSCPTGRAGFLHHEPGPVEGIITNRLSWHGDGFMLKGIGNARPRSGIL